MKAKKKGWSQIKLFGVELSIKKLWTQHTTCLWEEDEDKKLIILILFDHWSSTLWYLSNHTNHKVCVSPTALKLSDCDLFPFFIDYELLVLIMQGYNKNDKEKEEKVYSSFDMKLILLFFLFSFFIAFSFWLYKKNYKSKNFQYIFLLWKTSSSFLAKDNASRTCILKSVWKTIIMKWKSFYTEKK